MTALEDARRAVARGAWPEALDAFARAEISTLAPEDLEALADAAWWSCRLDESMAIRQKAYAGYMEAGTKRRAAYAAWFLAYDHYTKGEASVGSGWMGRAERLLSDEPECLEHAYLELAASDAAQDRGDFDDARLHAQRVLKIGERFGSADVVAMGVQSLGRILIGRGDVEAGTKLLDEAMTSVVAGELSPFITGWIYCNVLIACLGTADLRRAGEWAAAARAWIESLGEGTPYHGLCRMYQVEVTVMRGRWAEAESDAARASEELAAFEPHIASLAHYALGEIRRRRGDLREADAAFMRAHELGADPQPGLALLRLAEGNIEAAVAGLRLPLAGEGPPTVERARLLGAQVEVSLAAEDVDSARRAASELERIASARPANTFFEACAASARAAVHLAAAEVDPALYASRRAWVLWQELKLPYETARARVLLGLASRAATDEERARMEIEAARAAFERLGARIDAARAGALLHPPAAFPRGLSAREVEVLRLVAAGKTNRQIAAEMVISEHTVRRHLQNIFAKLNVTSRAAATAFAVENSLA